MVVSQFGDFLSFLTCHHFSFPRRRESIYNGVGVVKQQFSAASRERGQGRRRRSSQTLDAGPGRRQWIRDEAEFVERSFVLRGFLGLVPARARLFESCDGIAVPPTIYTISIKNRTMILSSISPPPAGRPGVQSYPRWTYLHPGFPRTTWHANRRRCRARLAQRPVEAHRQLTSQGHFGGSAA